MAYEPEFFRLQSELLQTKSELRAEREAHDALRIDTATKGALDANADIDRPMVEEVFRRGKPRVVDGVVIVDFPGDEGLVGSISELMQHMRDRPDQYGNIVGIKPKREPTAREKHLAWLQSLSQEQYNAYRAKHGRAYLDPPVD